MLSTLDIMDVATASQNASSDKKTPKRIRRPDHVFTLGIEEELQIIDPETRELRSHIQQILADGKIILNEQIKPELHQSIAEIGTEICSDARDARRQITALRTELAKCAAQHGLVIASAGTHPFSHWMDQLITINERYTTLINDMMFVWPDQDRDPTLVNNLVRMSQGKMMGVDFNIDKTWVGASIALHD